MPNRAILFVDGNNWYHGVKAAARIDPTELDLLRVGAKLAGPRQLVGLRYYIGQVPQSGNLELYAGQQRFLARLSNQDPRISIHLGRIESREAKSKAAIELLGYLANLKTRIDRTVYQELLEIGKRHRSNAVMVEKGVDVALAVDLVAMAVRDGFDTAYLLSADGDYTHAVESVRAQNKKIFAVSAGYGAQLAAVADKFLRLEPAWFKDCRHDHS